MFRSYRRACELNEGYDTHTLEDYDFYISQFTVSHKFKLLDFEK